MKYILLFIYRILNIIFSIIIATLMFFTFPIWPVFGYLFMGSDYFDMDVEDNIENVWNTLHYPLDKLYDGITDMDDDDIEFNFNKIFNNKFWK